MCADCLGPIDGDQSVNTGEELDLETDVTPTKPAPIAREKYCPTCKQTRNLTDYFCWLCGVELLNEPANACTKDETHKVDSPDHFCARCGAQTTYGIKKDGKKEAESVPEAPPDCDIPW